MNGRTLRWMGAWLASSMLIWVAAPPAAAGVGQARAVVPASALRRQLDSVISCAVSWRSVEALSGAWNNAMNGVAASSPKDVWGVGTSQDQITGLQQGLVQHWDGTSWTSPAVPAQGAAGDDLTDVSAPATYNAWISGLARSSSSSFSASAYSWNGTAWAAISVPSLAGNSAFNQVSATAYTNVWFGGYQTIGGASQAVVARWDGTAWTTYSLAPPGSYSSSVNSLVASSAADVWAAGFWISGAGAPRQALIVHWDGTGWHQYVAGLGGVGNELEHIAGSGSDAIAVGFTDSAGLRSPLALHWDGATWSVSSVAAPPGSGDATFEGLAEESSTDAWAVGYWKLSNAAADPTQPLIEHWDGTSWTISSTVNPAAGNGNLVSVVVPVAGDVWAVGDYRDPQKLDTNLVENYSSLTPPDAVNAAPGDGSALVGWAAPCSDGGSPVTSYVVSAYDGCSLVDSVTVSGTPPATTVNFPGLNNGIGYRFRVTPVNALGSGPISALSQPVVPAGPTAPTWLSACSPQQYSLTGSDGSTWHNVDASNLSITFRPGVDSYALIGGNADLWTANIGFNQDIGIAVAGGAYAGGSVAAWKESGGRGGAFAPNAAFVQTVVRLSAATSYTVALQWKANQPDPGTIYAGAGPFDGAFSPTRLTVQLIPQAGATVYTMASTRQYSLAFSNGTDWYPLDRTNLSVNVPIPAGSWSIVMSGNADLFTAQPDFNQDLGVWLSAQTTAGQPEAWKESGGRNGTYSPNAAFVQMSIPVTGGQTIGVSLVWKANRSDPGKIYAGAGPIAGQFSPTTLTVILLPGQVGSGLQVRASRLQYSQSNSDGRLWESIDSSVFSSTVRATVGAVMVGANADLWTADAGYNQDIALVVSGGQFGNGMVLAWKESGGSATYSPNAAYVYLPVTLHAGVTYTFLILWKANRLATSYNSIYDGAGPLASYLGNYSPTLLSIVPLS